MGGGLFQLMASFQNGRFSASSLTHTSIIPFLFECSVHAFPILIQCINHHTMNVSVYMITTARMAAGYFDLSQQEVRIEYPPIVLSKTMINPEVWTCFHHNRHRPVRTVVA